MKPGRYAARTADEAYTGRLLNHDTAPLGQLGTPAQRELVSSPRNQGLVLILQLFLVFCYCKSFGVYRIALKLIL